MGDGHLVALDEDGGCCASHADFALACGGPLDDGYVRRLHGGTEERVVSGRGGLLADGLDGDGARDLACRVTSHPDASIEALAVSSVTPQQAADNLVSAALTAGGGDNVTVIVIDVLNDGIADANRKRTLKHFGIVLTAVIAAFVVVGLCFYAFIRSEWYLGVNGDTVGIYQGVSGNFMGLELSELTETSSVEISDLPSSVQEQLAGGIRVNSEDQARETIKAYRQQITDEKTKAAETADEVKDSGTSSDGQTTSSSSGSTAPQGGE